MAAVAVPQLRAPNTRSEYYFSQWDILLAPLSFFLPFIRRSKLAPANPRLISRSSNLERLQ